MPDVRRIMSFFTEHEVKVWKAYQKHNGVQKDVAREFGVGDSAIASTLKSMRLKVMKLQVTSKEALELGLLSEEDKEIFKTIFC